MTPYVAVTGARGLLGSTLVKMNGYTPLVADIRDADAVLTEIKELKPSWIVHTAAKTNVAECERDPDEARAVNADGTKHVAEAARSVGARLIYISTASVFSGREGNYREADLPDPINVYNCTKREGELMTLAYEKGMVLRLNLIGVHPNGSRGKNFMEWLVDSVSANKDLTLFNDQLINPLSNWTITTLIKTIIEKDIHEKILHIGTSDVLSKAAIGKLTLAYFPNYTGKITEQSIDSRTDGVVRPKRMWLNCDRAKYLFETLPTCSNELKVIETYNGFAQLPTKR